MEWLNEKEKSIDNEGNIPFETFANWIEERAKFYLKYRKQQPATPTTRSYQTTSQPQGDDPRNYSRSTNESRRHNAPAGSWRNDINQSQPNPTWNSTFESRGNRPTTPFNSTTRYSAPRNKPFDSSTILTGTTLRTSPTNDCKFGNVSKIPPFIPQPTTQQSQDARTVQTGRSTNLTCIWCIEQKRPNNHSIDTCTFFEKAFAEEKWNTVRKNGLCMWCLQQHSFRSCPKGVSENTRCGFCRFSHHKALGCATPTPQTYQFTD